MVGSGLPFRRASSINPELRARFAEFAARIGELRTILDAPGHLDLEDLERRLLDRTQEMVRDSKKEVQDPSKGRRRARVFRIVTLAG